MNIELIGKHRVIMNSPFGKFNYFAWPSIGRLHGKRLALVASGFRYEHVCPFGKAVISYSDDEGESYTCPSPVIDTPLDDRDAGITSFGENSVIVTSFNNTVEFQRSTNNRRANPSAVIDAYLNTVSAEDEKKYLGSEFRISRDGGITFGEIHKSPITSPHGPTELSDGTLLWVGRTFTSNDTFRENEDEVRAYKINDDGSMEYVGAIPHIYRDGKKVLSCEPHAIELDDGSILCHIRVQNGSGLFTVYQTVSTDGGRTWSEPVQLLADNGGSPAHLIRHSSGVIVSTYGYRNMPFGIRAMLSRDNGKTWEKDFILYEDTVSGDLGYPCTAELKDGTMLTVFYAHEKAGEPAVILQQKWRIKE